MIGATGYNGWSTFETWAVALWLGNDSDTYNYWISQARRLDIGALAGMLRDTIQENCPIQDASLYQDLVFAAIDEVDFYEIAMSFKDDE